MKKIILLIFISTIMILNACKEKEEIPNISKETYAIETQNVNISAEITTITQENVQNPSNEVTSISTTITVIPAETSIITTKNQFNNIKMPSQDYIAIWETTDDPPNDLKILKIDNDKIKFHIGIFRLLGTDGTAKIENEKIVFNTDAGFSGTMEFNEDDILVTVNKSDFEYINVGTFWKFNIRKDLTNDIIDLYS